MSSPPRADLSMRSDQRLAVDRTQPGTLAVDWLPVGARLIAILRHTCGRVPPRARDVRRVGLHMPGDRDTSLISQTKTGRDENQRLKEIHPVLSVQADLLEDALRTTDTAISAPREGQRYLRATRIERRARLPCLWGERSCHPRGPNLDAESDEIAGLLRLQTH